VIRSIETDGNHWLILDEINRGDISALLAPALDALGPEQPGSIEHPNLFPERETQAGSIPIPGSFRIIGTMNPFDDDLLFSFTHAFNRRIGFVYIPPLLNSDEQAYLDIFAVKRHMESLGIEGHEIEDFKDRFYIRQPLGRIIHTIARIRALSHRDPKHLHQHCEIGTSLALEAARRVCALCTEDVGRAKNNSDSIADRALRETILGRTEDFSRQALIALKNEVFEISWAKTCAEQINIHLSAS
jgi:hypothetical protein